MDSLRTRSQLITEAKAWLGTPWHHRTSLKGVGVDCFELPRAAFNACGLEWPAMPEPYASIIRNRDWWVHSERECLLEVLATVPTLCPIPRDAASLGDVLVFGYPGRPGLHMGMVSQTIPDLRFLHVGRPCAGFTGVAEQGMNELFRQRWRCAYAAKGLALP